MAVIQGYTVRELRCKNDSCRKLLGYDQVTEGLIVFICTRCKQPSIFKINYRHGRELIDKIKGRVEEPSTENERG